MLYIVSSVQSQNIPIKGQHLTVGEFIDLASTQINVTKLYFNVNDLDESIYEMLYDSLGEMLILFSLENHIPAYAENLDVLYWLEPVENPVDESIEEEDEDPQDQFEEDIFDEQEDIIKINHGNTDSESEYDFEEEDEEDPVSHNTEIDSLFNASVTPSETFEEQAIDNKEAEVYVFGSSKGGSGKTFTCVISAYRYAKQNPHKKVALADFDIVDGQIGITIHKIEPTMFNFFRQWVNDDKSFDFMKNYKVNSQFFPANLDFYLAPKDLVIKNDEFWEDVFRNLILNYDRVYFDTGISYMEHHPIYTLYKIADKIILTSSTSIKSTSSVLKQIMKLKGENKNEIFSPEDNIGPRLNVVITQAVKGSSNTYDVINRFKNLCNVNVLGVFGYLTNDIEKAEYSGAWHLFDNKEKFCELVDKINS